MKKFIFGVLACLFTMGVVHAQCPEGSVWFLGQSDVEDFLAEYPDCTELQTLYVQHPGAGLGNGPISFLGMENIVSINTLNINQSGNEDPDVCFSFEGLSSVENIGSLISTAKLCNFEGLDALASLGDLLILSPQFDSTNDQQEFIQPEHSLSFTGLESLQQIDSLTVAFWELNDLEVLSGVPIMNGLTLGNCTGFSSLSDFNLQNSAALFLSLLPELTSLSGIENISSVEYLRMAGLPNLDDIEALTSLQHIGDTLLIAGTGFQELSVFDNLELIGGGVTIYDNPNLSVCSFQYLCEHPEILGTVENNAEGCNSFAEIAEDCVFSSVSGMVYVDVNCNGEKDDNEPEAANTFVYRNADDPFTTTNVLGEYSGWLAAEQDFEMMASAPLGFSSNVENISTTNEIQVFENVDFALCPDGEFANLVVSLTPSSGPPQPGFNNSYEICVSNHGSVAVDAGISLNFNLVPDITIVESDGGTIDGPTINWTVELLSPFESECFTVTINSSPETPLGTIYSMYFEGSVINSSIPEIDPTDNQHFYEDIVVGSYDPNDKSVDNEVVNMENVAPDSAITLEYLIRFQNTGTAPATFIHVIDLLAPELDVTTLEMIHASHDYVLNYDAPDKLDWFFEDINLPDSTSNEPESHGFIHFRINTFPGMEVGDVIENYASIYFDYNAPIVTEDAVTKFMLCPVVEIGFDIDQLSASTVGDSHQWYFNGELIEGATDPWWVPSDEGVYSLHVYWEDGCVESATYYYGNVSVVDNLREQIKLMPNPATEMTSVLMPAGEWEVSLFNINGKQVAKTERVAGNRLDVQLNALPPGVYFVHVQSNNDRVVKKLVVE